MGGILGNLAEKASFGLYKASASGGVSDLQNPSAWLIDALNTGSKTASGEAVTAVSVLRNPEYLAAVKNISEDVAKLPMDIYKSLEGGGKEKKIKHKAQYMVHFRANKNVSSQDFYQTLTHHAINGGNGYAEIVRDGANNPVEMHIIHPSRVTPFFREDEDTGGTSLWYEIKSSFRMNGKQMKAIMLPAEDMIHIKGLGDDGIVGYSIYALVAEALYIGMAADKFSAAFFGNGTTLTGVLENAGELSDKAYARLRKDWAKLHKGAKNAHGLAILEAGTKFTAIATDPEKSQLIETRRYHAIVVARILRIPPHKIASMDAATFGNIEEQNIEYNRDTLAPWMRRWHMELTYKLFPRDSGFFAQFEFSALSLGDSKTRSEVYRTLFNTASMTPNQIRDSEGMNRETGKPEMDDYYMQLNMSTAKRISTGEAVADNSASPAAMAHVEMIEDFKADQPAPAIEAQITPLEAFEAHRANYLPLFEAAAERNVIKEENALKANIESKKDRRIDFARWSEKFFRTQADEMKAAFSPACQVFVKTFKSEGHILEFGFLSDFADNYAAEGREKAELMYKEYAENGYKSADIEKEREKLALNVVNNIGQTVKKEAQND